MYLPYTDFLVYGLKKSGISAADFLLKRGASVWLFDDDKNNYEISAVKNLVARGAKIKEDENALDGIDAMVLSPGVPIDSPLNIEAKSRGIKIISELMLGASYVTEPMVAVTGTNGKTTTCSLISSILCGAKINNKLVGNVGTPITKVVDDIKRGDIIVTEVSSFQMEATNRFLPHIAVVLNVTPDHLERHYTFENYAFLKCKMLMNLTETEYAVINADDETVKSFATKTRGKVVWFSLNEKVDGAYLSDGYIYFLDEKIIAEKDVNLIGEHNLSNVLAAVAVLKLLGLDGKEIESGIKGFRGVKHRVELVRELDGVEYYNDSKATNPDAVIKAVNSIKRPVTIILGGYDKGLDYTPAFIEIKKGKKVRHIVITGANAKKVYDAACAEGFESVSVLSDFKSAVITARGLAKGGEAVLLSPGTSGFDNFSGYEERGDKFIEIVKSFKQST